MSQGLKLPLLLLTSAIFLLVIALPIVVHYNKNPQVELPMYGEVQDFSLVNSENKEISRKDLTGKVWVACFIFTTCQGICIPMTESLASLHRSYVLDDRVRMVSISVNPEFDTPQILQEFAKKYQANTKKWYFLTGSRDVIQELGTKSFKLADPDDIIYHSEKFALVDHKNQIRGYYNGTEPEDVKRLFVDIAYLMERIHDN